MTETIERLMSWNDTDFEFRIGLVSLGRGVPDFAVDLGRKTVRYPDVVVDAVGGGDKDLTATAPVLIAVEAKGAISMWQPYNGLRYLKKPVDMVALNTDEHVLTNPVERMTSQSLSVDWFRFWLQGSQDSDPAKADQYKRWRELRTMQAENDKKGTATQASSN